MAFNSDYHQCETRLPVTLVEGEVLVQNRFVRLSMMVGLVHNDALGEFSVKRWYNSILGEYGEIDMLHLL